MQQKMSLSLMNHQFSDDLSQFSMRNVKSDKG